MAEQVAQGALAARLRLVYPRVPAPRCGYAGLSLRHCGCTTSLRGVLAASLAFGAACFPQAAAHAQISPSILITPQTPDHMRAYQEQTVAENGEGDWSALGIRVGAFKVSPRVSVGQNFTSNAYATADAKAAAIERVELDLKAQSQWSRHSLVLGANRQWDFYVGRKDRNRDNWSVNASGDVDVTSSLQINLDADVNRTILNTLTSDFIGGEVLTSGAVIAMVYDHASLGATRTFGNSRFVVQAERYHVDFNDADRFAETRSLYLDHDVYQVSAQGEYSFTPAVAVFTRLNFATSDYGSGGNLNASTQDSKGGRLIVGARATVPGLGRATVAVAYSRRSYDSANLSQVSGLSAQARVDLFVSALTTVNAEVGTRISEFLLTSTNSSRDRYVQVGADHALLRNFSLRADARLQHRKPLLSGTSSTYSSLNFIGTYLASRRFGLSGRISYVSRSFAQTLNIPSINEMSGGITLTYRI
jgi:hypothetical protein